MRIVYNSFEGRFSDTPRAIFERLAQRPGTEHVWLADPAHLAGFAAGVDTVDIDGPHARDVLEACDLLVANTHTDLDWDKRPGTTYLQTWHGTPLKRIHHDVLWAPPGRLDRLDLDVARWDLLLSPNPVSTPRLRKAFGYDGPVVETGYPRNDVLHDPVAAGAVRRRVRDDLAVPDDATVVLYAPTWRDVDVLGTDDEVTHGLDLSLLTEGLGEGFRVLLRAHSLVGARARWDRLPGVHDVSGHPDIADLYLAADVLVTDYSSAMFDFANTGKPLVLLAYDLEEFRDRIRGFYFDPLPGAPGPVVRTTSELVGVLHDLPSLPERYAASYATFRETYCALEDGHATDRVLDLLGLAQG